MPVSESEPEPEPEPKLEQEEMGEKQIEEENELNIPNIKKIDLKIIKYMWEQTMENERGIAISEIVKEIFDIDSRVDMQDKYPTVKYRLKKMAENGLVSVKKLEDKGFICSLSDNISVGEFNGKMDVLGYKEDIEVEKMLLLRIKDTAIFIPLNV